MNAWADACKWNGEAKLLIPLGVYMVNVVTFSGPCEKSTLTFQIKGIIKAPTSPKFFCDSSWISFQYINNLKIEGGGTLDGQGSFSWGKHQCSSTVMLFYNYLFL